MSRDILFDHGNARFSCRMSALIVQGGRILLQCPAGTQEYAFPGGHTAFGETSAETLRRELLEELHADAAIGRLAAVGEVFIDWGAARTARPATAIRSACISSPRWTKASSPPPNASLASTRPAASATTWNTAGCR